MTASLLALALSSLLVSACGSKSAANANAANNQPTTIDVQTTKAVVKQIPSYFEATGNLASDESTDVAPAVSGKISQVNFDVGSYVAKGSVLIRLDPRDAQIRLEQSQAQLEQQKKGVDQAVAALRQAQVRLGIKDGETFDIETFSQVKTTKANLTLAEIELQRAERLYATGDISRSILDQRRASRDALLGTLDEARSTAAVAVKAINAAEAQVASARAAVAASETQVASARKGVTDTEVLSPISGYVSERVADPGEYISPSAPNTKIATIMRTSILRLRIDIPEQQLGRIAVGQNISMQTSAYPDRNFNGKVVRILPSLNATARTLTIEAEVSNGDNLLKPGQFAVVRLTQPQPENAVMVPAAAVKTDGDVSKVYVVKDGAAREVIVQLGLLENDLIQIKQGIGEGDVIATSNIDKLNDGILVRAS